MPDKRSFERVRDHADRRERFMAIAAFGTGIGVIALMLFLGARIIGI